MALNQSEVVPQQTSEKGSPRQISEQLGLSVQEVLAAIEFARLEPLKSDAGEIEYEVKPVMTAFLEQVREKENLWNAQNQQLIRECVDACQESLRQMIREENRVAYQVKDITESRFLEVLGQVSLSMGRVEAFVMQASRLLSQIDMRLNRIESLRSSAEVQYQEEQDDDLDEEDTNQKQTVQTVQVTEQTPPLQTPALVKIQPMNQPQRQLSNSEHWREFETQMTRSFFAKGQMADSAISDWLAAAKSMLNLGSLELRLNGELLLENLRPALLDSSFAGLHFSVPSEADVLPAFEKFQAWVRHERSQGHAAILLYLVLILNRGPQISWSGFLATFVNEE